MILDSSADQPLIKAAVVSRVDDHTLMSNETVYTNVFFPIPQDKALYVVGFAADIDNTKRVHHIVAYLCNEDISKYNATAGATKEPASEEENGVHLWLSSYATAVWSWRGVRENLSKNRLDGLPSHTCELDLLSWTVLKTQFAENTLPYLDHGH